MSKSILYLGLDVDDKAFHGCGYCKETGEYIEFKCRPTFGALIKKLEKFQQQHFELKLCYEASYTGYSLCRDLRAHGIYCEIIAPSLIPEKSGNRAKTDRIDSIKLAKEYADERLTAIYIPDEEDEQVRDLIRSRSFLVKLRKELKCHILSTCRRYKINYKEEKGTNVNYWTKMHIDWLQSKIKELDKATLQNTLEILLLQFERFCDGISTFEQSIEELALTDRYKVKVDALNCHRGLGTLSSMTIATEIGDINRFSHPKSLVAYIGLDLSEYSSGGKEKKLGITKMGNKRIRTTLVEAVQSPMRPILISKGLKKRREGQDIKLIAIADRCSDRLKKKSTRMYHAGKHINKVKTACAREMVGFIWETLKMVS